MVWLVLIAGTFNLGLGYLAAASLADSPPWAEWRLPVRWPRWLGALRRRAATRRRRPPSDDDTERDRCLHGIEPKAESLQRPASVDLKALPTAWQALLESESIKPQREVEVAAQVLRLEGNQLREQLITNEGRARNLLAAGDAEGLKLLSEDMRSISLVWLESQTMAAEMLARERAAADECGTRAAHLEQVLLDQAAEIQAACIVLDSLDARTEARTSGKFLLEQIAVLIDLAHSLRDHLQSALATLLVRDQRLEELVEPLTVDRLTGLNNRAGLEVLMADWRRRDPQRSKPFAAVLVDIDRFSRVNHRVGTRAGDRTLAALARLIDELLPTDRIYARVARTGGQAFCVLLGETLPQQAVTIAESLRQAVEATTFDDQGVEFELTLSCGVVDAKAPESVDELLRRASEAARFAKKAGRNRCAIDDGTGPAIQEPQQLPVKGRVVRLGHG